MFEKARKWKDKHLLVKSFFMSWETPNIFVVSFQIITPYEKSLQE
jgi:hypothetical protein